MAHEMVVGARRTVLDRVRRTRPARGRRHRTPTVTSRVATSGPTGDRERGAVTAEAAAALPVLLAVALGLLWVVSLAGTQVRVVDTAREVARAEARGDAAGDVGSGPADVEVSVSRRGERVRVVATSEVSGPGGIFRLLPSVRLSSTAWAAEEPTS